MSEKSHKLWWGLLAFITRQVHEDWVLLGGRSEQPLHPPHCEPTPLLLSRVQHQLDRLERLLFLARQIQTAVSLQSNLSTLLPQETSHGGTHKDTALCSRSLGVQGNSERELLPTVIVAAVCLAATALLASW